MNYTQLLNKEVISIFDGQKCGKVHCGNFNHSGKLSSLIISDNEKFQTLDIKDIFACANDCIMIKNNTKLIVANHANNKLLHKEVFTISGKCVGHVSDIIVNEKFYIDKIITNSAEFSFNQIIKNNNIIVINDENSHYKPHQFAPKAMVTAKSIPQQKVVITTKIPIKVNSKSFFLGKKLFKDFVSKDNIVLARKNNFVSQSLINIAKEHNSLFELSQCVL